MYRLLTARNIYQNSLHSKYFPSNNSLPNSSIPDIKCSFCRKILLGHHNIENLMLTRHQSTRMVNAVKSMKKRGKHKNYKKYGELLEVGDQAMTETKVSISNLRGEHLSKLTSSPVSLGQLHQIVKTKTKKLKNIEVDTELLQSVKNKILNKSSTVLVVPKDVVLEDDKCALLYTHCHLAQIEDKIKTKQFMDMVKESYYNFRKATIYDQRLSDLRYAINEGVHQEFRVEPQLSPDSLHVEEIKPLPRSPHAVFRELFLENDAVNYDHEYLTHMSSFQNQALVHPSLEEIFDDHDLLHDLHPGTAEAKDMPNVENVDEAKLKTLNIKKARQALKQKKKANREKRRVAAEANMKEEMQTLERRARHGALQRLLAAHTRLLCDLHQPHQARQILQYYRRRSKKSLNYPQVTDVKIYNILLHGFAAKGQTECVRELMVSMRADGVTPDAQSYAAVFEAVERAPSADKVPALERTLRDMRLQGITLNDLADKCEFEFDQHEVVTRAIRRLQPQFTPCYTPPELDYDCPLLEDIKLDQVENRVGLAASPAAQLMSGAELAARGRDQLRVELAGELEVRNVAVADDAVQSPAAAHYRSQLEQLETGWRETLREAFVRNLGTLRSQCGASHCAVTLYPYLTVLPVEEFVELMMAEVRALVEGSETYSPTLTLLQRDLGARVCQRYQTAQARRNGTLDKLEQVYAEYCEWFLDRRPLDASGRPLNCRQAWQLIAHKHRDGPSLDTTREEWSADTRQQVGKFLYNIIVHDVKIDVNMFKQNAKPRVLPAVYRVHRAWGRGVRLELKPAPAWARAAALAGRATLALRAELLPLRAPPAPWRRPAHGPYRAVSAPLVRMPYNVSQQRTLLETAPAASLYPVYDALNQLGAVPWRLNTRLLDLQLQLFRAGGDKRLDIPPPASALDVSAFKLAGDDKGSEYKRRLAIARARAEMHSLWCDANYKLSLANHYRDDIFWLPHNLDFRGRVYAVPPHLSQLGADTARALLLLAERRPLGAGGLRWLQLHCVNLTGNVKRKTVDERLEYAESVMDQILDSADRPLTGGQWWKQSEEPWQTLAACMEIANAVRSPNPEEYMSGFPVHQDGSCNGLQHYAALGGDSAGAAAVNLAPSRGPRDVYTDVATLVEAQRARDAAAGVAAAQVLEGFVRRKVIKQTVMTTVYGVTRFGARLQIAKQLKDIEKFPSEQVWPCSQYLTAATFASLREMFTSTKLIQDWLTDAAKVISGVCGTSVSWVTPLGLPVVQPYHRRSHAPAPRDLAQRPCTIKQRNAFPPNYIHSLDSTHMMLTALHCEARGVAFVSVHDCFWTHPSTVTEMNKICRSQFVALHSRPLLQELSEHLVRAYSYHEAEVSEGAAGAALKRRVNSTLRAVPPRGDFDINSVLNSVYFFS